MDTDIHNRIIDTAEWRSGVMVSLEMIRGQLGRLVSDRDSEKQTMQRVSSEFRNDIRALNKDLGDHQETDHKSFAEIHKEVSRVEKKVVWIFGLGTGINILMGLMLMVKTAFPGGLS